MRLFIVANLTRPTVQPFLDAKLDWIKRHADLVGMDSECHAPLDQVEADAILVGTGRCWRRRGGWGPSRSR